MKSSIVLRLKLYARVAYFDSDVLIRNDAPNCFDVFDDPAKLYAVRDISETRDWVPSQFTSNFLQTVRAPYYVPLRQNLGWELDYQQYLSNFFNTGFFVCSPRYHQALFEFIESHLPNDGSPHCGNYHYEQALINYAAQLLANDAVEFVDETWNFIDPDLRNPQMAKFVYHFTGAMSKMLKTQLPAFPWKI